MFSQIKDRKHIEQNFHSVAKVMPPGWDCGVLGESRTLAWGFAMAPHRLRALVLVYSEPQHVFKYMEYLKTLFYNHILKCFYNKINETR